jgi:polyisoprenoid-binding protein YceI
MMRRPVLLALAFSLAIAGAASAGKVYQAIPGESTLTYVIDHPMHKVTGVSRDFVCRVVLSPDTLSSKVEVSADVKTFDSGNPNRDDHALEAIRAYKHPKVAFASDSVRKDGEAYRVFGRLTFAGKTRPVDFTVTDTREGGKVRIAGGFSVKLTDFDVERPSLLFIPAKDRLDIRFDLYARDDGASAPESAVSP